MGSGISGLYVGTHGSPIFIGSLDYMSSDDEFSLYIKKRKDVDPGDYIDIIAHGSAKKICIQHNGKTVTLSHNAFARYLVAKGGLTKAKIRLLSCNTGIIPHGFAQGLADRLNVEVLAPKGYVAVNKFGHYGVYKGKRVQDKIYLYQRTNFETFYPKGGKNNGM
jgi:ABC-type nitrate/sulfonate/bicarbonate transport system substrate-binding protein